MCFSWLKLKIEIKLCLFLQNVRGKVFFWTPNLGFQQKWNISSIHAKFSPQKPIAIDLKFRTAQLMFGLVELKYKYWFSIELYTFLSLNTKFNCSTQPKWHTSLENWKKMRCVALYYCVSFWVLSGRVWWCLCDSL